MAHSRANLPLPYISGHKSVVTGEEKTLENRKRENVKEKSNLENRSIVVKDKA